MCEQVCQVKLHVEERGRRNDEDPIRENAPSTGKSSNSSSSSSGAVGLSCCVVSFSAEFAVLDLSSTVGLLVEVAPDMMGGISSFATGEKEGDEKLQETRWRRGRSLVGATDVCGLMGLEG